MAEIAKIRITSSQEIVNEFIEHIGEKDRTGKLEIRSLSGYHAFSAEQGTRVVEVEIDSLKDLLTNSEEELIE